MNKGSSSSSEVDTAFQRDQSKIDQGQPTLMLTMKKNSLFKVRVYRRLDGVDMSLGIYCFRFLFA